MMDPVLAIIIASGMTQTQFAMQLRESISTSAYLKNFDLMLGAVTSLHGFLESTKKFKSWGSATDAAKKAFQRLEDTMRKCTGLLQRCISARSKLLQLVSDQALKKSDFQQMCMELDDVMAEVPTETMPEALHEQLNAVRQQLQTTPFVEAISPEMKATFERLLKEEATGVRKQGGPKFAAGQLAQQLGFEGHSSFRKEQEALALERRKALESRDKTQEVVLEQVAMVLLRMEKELPPYTEIQKLKAAALSLPTLKSSSVKDRTSQPSQVATSGRSSAAGSPAQRGLPEAMEEQLSLSSAGGIRSTREASARQTGDTQTSSPGAERRQRERGFPASASSRPVGGRTTEASRYARVESGSNRGSSRGNEEDARGAKAPPQQQQQPRSAQQDMSSAGGSGRVPERVRKDLDDRSVGLREGQSGSPRVTGRASGDVARSKGQHAEEGASSRRREEEARGRGVPDAAQREALNGDGRDALADFPLTADIDPSADLAAHDPQAAKSIVQKLALGKPEEQRQAAAAVGLYTAFSASNRATFREAGALDALLPLVSKAHDAKTMEAAVGALLNLSSEEESKAVLAGHLPELVQCVKEAETPAARSGMASIIRSVAHTSEARAAAVDAGVVPHLIKLLNLDDMSKQAAAEAIASLAKCESRRSTLVIQGAVMPLALALRSNPVPETLTAICSSLASLAAVPEGREAMGLGVPSLVNVLRLDYPDALKDAVEALLLLARHSPTYRSSIRNNGGMRYLRNVLRSGPPSLHPKAMELLAALFS